jgi:hypothetical protein
LGRVGLIEAIHGFDPVGALRASKIAPGNFVEPTPLRGSGFS